MNQIKAGAFLNYVIIGLNILVGLLYTPFMLRCLGQNEYGIYSLVASIIAYLTILDFGFGNAIIRYTAKFRAEGKLNEQWQLFGMFIVVYSGIGLIAFLGGMTLYANVDSLFDQTMTGQDLSQAKTMMLILSANLAFTFPLSIYGSIVTAYEDFIFLRIVNIMRIVISTVVMISLLSFGFKAIALVVVQTVFNLLTLLCNLWYCYHKIHIKISFGKFNIPLLKEVSIYSFWIFLNSIMDRIYWSSGQFVLGAISGTIAVAIFSVAILLQQMYMSFSGSIASVLLPRITSMVAKAAANHEISNLFIKTGRLQSIVVSFILFGFIIFGKTFITLWAGNDYIDSYLITVVLFIALFIPLIQNTGITILQARNQMKFRSLLYIVIALISLISQIALSKVYGVFGCTIAIAGALIIGQGLIMNIYYHKKQHINIKSFWSQIGIQSIYPLIISILFFFLWNKYGDADILKMAVGIILYSTIYIIGLYRFSLNDYERNIIKSPLGQLIKRRRI